MGQDQLQQLIDAVPVPREPRKRLTPFSSSDANDWIAWKRTFEATAQLNDWDDDARVSNLAAALEGEASNRASAIDFAGKTPAEALAAIDDVFLPPGSSRLAQALFDEARQGREETIVEWHGRLRNIFRRAYPNDAIENSAMLKKRFILGLTSPMLIKDVLMQDPATYANCLQVTSDKASILKTLRQAGLLKSGLGGPNEVSALSDGDIRPPGDNNRLICYYCKKRGHVKAECLALKNKNERDRKAGNPLGGRNNRRSINAAGGGPDRDRKAAPRSSGRQAGGEQHAIQALESAIAALRSVEIVNAASSDKLSGN